MSKTKSLIGGKTLSLWIPDEDWVDDFNHVLAKRTKSDRSLSRNALFLQCVEKGLQYFQENVEDKEVGDSVHIYLDTLPTEQAELLRTTAGKQLVTNLLAAILSGQIGTIGSLLPIAAAKEAPTKGTSIEVQSAKQTPPPSEAAHPQPVVQPERKIPDLFHTLMRNTNLS